MTYVTRSASSCGVVALRAIEVFLGARAALGGQVGIAAVPLEGLGAGEIFEERLSTMSLPKPSGSRSHFRPSKVESRWQLAQPNCPWNE